MFDLRARITALREKLGPAGFTMAIIALVFALAGGAFAASGGLTGRQKKEVKAIAKSFQGTGPQGPAGPAGTNGTNGKDGAPGAKGENGTNGTSVTGVPASGSECSGNGGVKYTSASGTNLVCNGEEGTPGNNGISPAGTEFSGSQGTCTAGQGGVKFEGANTTYACNGSPWTAGGTLPTGATETGAWGLTTTVAASPKLFPPIFEEHVQTVPISFPVPLSATPAESHMIYVPVGDTTTNHCSATAPNGPGGTAANPKADSGYLCVYAKELLQGSPAPNTSLGNGFSGVAPSGATLLMTITGDTFAIGSWAVTG